MNKKDLSERDICSKFIGPAVKRAGWDGMMQIREEVNFTKGRIIVRGISVAMLIAHAPQSSPVGTTQSGASSTTALGEVTGIASPCVGLTTLAGFEALPVRVTLVQRSNVVTAETVTGDHQFLLAAPPGRYVLTSDQYQRPMRFSVVLRGLQTAEVNLPVSCK